LNLFFIAHAGGEGDAASYCLLPRPIMITIGLECPSDRIHRLFTHNQIVAECHKYRVDAILNRCIEALPPGVPAVHYGIMVIKGCLTFSRILDAIRSTGTVRMGRPPFGRPSDPSLTGKYLSATLIKTTNMFTLKGRQMAPYYFT
jgi:hypothetical protein